MKNLDDKTKKALAIEKAKQDKVIKASATVDNLTNADLDNKQLMKELNKITLPSKAINSNIGMFRYSTLIDKYDSMSKEQQRKITKPLRRKIRNKRNSFFVDIVTAFKNNNQKELKKQINLFMKFYKESYLLNDLSINSIARSSSDKANIVFITASMQVIKNNK